MLQKLIEKQILRNWWYYLIAIALVALATGVGHMARSFLTITNIAMLYLLCVVITSVLWGLGPSILTCVLGVLAHDFFFIMPYLSLGPPDIHDIPTLIVLLVVGVIISYLTSRVRWQAEDAQRREHESATFYALSRNLAVTNEMESTLQAIKSKAREIFGCQTAVFLPDVKHKERLVPHLENQGINHDKDDYAAAALSFYQRKLVGQGTNTLPQAKARYLPLNSARGVTGVLALYFDDPSNRLATEQSRLIEVFADLTAVAVERALLTDEVRDAQVLKAKEKLQTALFSSISHDLRTPLVSVIGVLSSLQEEGMTLDDSAKRNLIQVAREEAERLNHLIANLLDSSRIEAGSIKLHRQPSELQEILNVSLERLGNSSATRPININMAAELPLISVDFGLMAHVFVNILDNALKYSAAGSPVDISAREMEDDIEIEVCDRGIGIPAEDLMHVFDRFYRVQRPASVTGTGLGLSICKGIVEAHGGHISLENRPDGGTIVHVTIPIDEVYPGA
ncbi:MAG TPA: ATP-binding protein [Dehalococcoidia bacterium]|nr:ATP-binding protein [Dehalococcoidia bacterium]